jgi:hypothetical protein
LRWGVFIPEAERTWPAWQSADWDQRGKLAGEVSRILIRNHPLGALWLWGQDWLTLILQPAYWPASITTMTTDTSDFIACGRDGGCWALQRYDIPMRSRLALFAASLAGPVVALLLIGLNARQVLCRRADSALVLFFLIAVVVHATLLMTSAFEAGGARYTVAIHMLEVPLLIWAAARFGRWISDRWSLGRWRPDVWGGNRRSFGQFSAVQIRRVNDR